MGNGKSALGPIELTEAIGREAAPVLRMGHDLSGKGSRSSGLGPTGGRIWLVSGLEEESDGLGPSARQLKHKNRCKLNGSGPMAHVSGLGRLVEDGPSLNPISKAPKSLPYNRRAEQERVLALSNTGDDFVELRYDQSYYLPSTSSPYVSFGKEGGCEMFGEGGGGGGRAIVRGVGLHR